MPSAFGVTAIVPTYNRSTFLKEALTSLLAQTMLPDEIIVVDDGSTDDTAEVVAGVSSQIIYLRQANKGKSAALNLALKHAANELIYILDDDDLAMEDCIERLVEGLKHSPECGFSYGGHNAFRVSASGDILIEPRDSHPPDDDRLSLTLMQRCLIFQSNMLVRKSCYDQVGAFNEEFIRSQDYEMLLRLVRRFQGKQIDGLVFSQRQHAGIRGSSTLRIKAQDNAAVWHRFNQRIFKSIYSMYALEEFLPGARNLSSEADRITALLQRCVIMGRRELWDLAAQDMRMVELVARRAQIHDLSPEQSTILHGMFGPPTNAIWNFANALDFRTAMREISHPVLSKQIHAALGAPLVKHMLHSIKHKEIKSVIYLLACLIYFSPSGGTLAHHCGDLALKLVNLKHAAKVPTESVPSI
ncbi:MAG TPA: glycosyltransferase family 2 protein [Edaphobacter sp.]|nr:glycosyltransferase family 2 protein [Edaphobacter sp.]